MYVLVLNTSFRGYCSIFSKWGLPHTSLAFDERGLFSGLAFYKRPNLVYAKVTIDES